MLTKKCLSTASLLRNLPFPLFAKEGCITSLFRTRADSPRRRQREARRDFMINVFMLVSVLAKAGIEKLKGSEK
jgi:hypothetical protein